MPTWSGPGKVAEQGMQRSWLPASLARVQVKLIAEPWDLGLYMVGSFPNWDSWKEWNGQYRDDVRRFIK